MIGMRAVGALLAMTGVRRETGRTGAGRRKKAWRRAGALMAGVAGDGPHGRGRGEGA